MMRGLAVVVVLPVMLGAGTVREGRLRDHVRFLADDAMAGREAGEAQIERAENYIARAFERAGLRPLPGRSSYFVPFSLYRTGFDRAATHLELTIGDETVALQPGRDFRPFPFSDEGEAATDVVFAGYGIDSEEHGWSDYENLDVQGKLVLVLRHEPWERDPDSSFDGTENTQHATFQRKAQVAAERGAAGMLLVTDPLHHEEADDFRMGRRLSLEPPEGPAPSGAGASTSEAEQSPPFLAVQISREAAEALASSSGRTLSELQEALDEGTPAADLALHGTGACLFVAATPVAEVVRGRNVGGFLEGSDPRLRDEWVVVGAHHDHVGAYYGHGDTIFNGADDNASGTAAVLELARVLAAGPPPRRSIAFLTFSAEEKGLLGSRALVRQELLPVERVVFMLNLDMIGRNPERPVTIYGDGYARGLRELVEDAAAPTALELRFAGDGYAANSDHDAFYRRDIPFLFPFTGTHADYHQIGDHADKIAFDHMTEVVRLARGIVERVADTDAPLPFIHHVTWLGVRVEVLPQEPSGMAAQVTHVDADSRAEKAGIREGDVLVAFDEAPLEDPYAVGRAFRAAEPGTRVELALRRGGEPIAVEVERARRGYLGIFPGEPSEEQRKAAGLTDDQGVLVRRIVPEGPSAEAGIQESDILLEMAGRTLSTRTLGRVLAQIGAGEQVDVLLVRDGERLDLPLILGERPRRR